MRWHFTHTYSDLVTALHVTAWIFLHSDLLYVSSPMFSAWICVPSPNSSFSIICSKAASTPLPHFSNLFKSEEHLGWLEHKCVMPLIRLPVWPGWQMVGESWKQDGEWRVVIYLPIALLPAPALFDETYLWIIKTHRSLVEACQACCWCTLCRTDTQIPCVDMKWGCALVDSTYWYYAVHWQGLARGVGGIRVNIFYRPVVCCFMCLCWSLLCHFRGVSLHRFHSFDQSSGSSQEDFISSYENV